MARFGRRKGAEETAAKAPETGTQPPAGGAATPGAPAATASATGQPPVSRPTGSNPLVGPDASINERLEGQRSWLAQLDRRIGVRTYAGAAALVIALAAAAVALVLVLQLQDESATTADVEQLREEIAGVEDTASEAAQDDVQALTERIGELESQVSDSSSSQDSADKEISVLQDDIQDLRDQIDALDEGSGSGRGGSAETP